MVLTSNQRLRLKTCFSFWGRDSKLPFIQLTHKQTGRLHLKHKKDRDNPCLLNTLLQHREEIYTLKWTCTGACGWRSEDGEDKHSWKGKFLLFFLPLSLVCARMHECVRACTSVCLLVIFQQMSNKALHMYANLFSFLITSSTIENNPVRQLQVNSVRNVITPSKLKSLFFSPKSHSPTKLHTHTYIHAQHFQKLSIKLPPSLSQ